MTLRNSVRMTEPQTQRVFTGSWTVNILLFDRNCPGTSFFKHLMVILLSSQATSALILQVLFW